MPIILKNRQQVEAMRRAGGLAAQIMGKMAAAVRPGITTQQLEQLLCHELTKAGATSPYKGHPRDDHNGFPAHCCISVNEEVVHGVPGPRVLNEGDVVTLDVGLRLDGYCASRVVTVGVGRLPLSSQQLVQVAEEALEFALHQMEAGRKWSEIARIIQLHIESNGYSVLREFVGHGIGQQMVEDPPVPNFVSGQNARQDFRLRPGMTLTVEPMVLSGRRNVGLSENGWTVFASDKMPAAHFRHTVAVTDDGVQVLTEIPAL